MSESDGGGARLGRRHASHYHRRRRDVLLGSWTFVSLDNVKRGKVLVFVLHAIRNGGRSMESRLKAQFLLFVFSCFYCFLFGSLLFLSFLTPFSI